MIEINGISRNIMKKKEYCQISSCKKNFSKIGKSDFFRYQKINILNFPSLLFLLK